MREYILPIVKSLTVGQRPEPETPGYMTTCLFARPAAKGLVAPRVIVDPFGGAQLEGQLIRGNTVTLLATTQRVSAVDESDWSVTADTGDSFVGSYPWHFVDMNNAWMLLSPTATVYKDNSAGMFGETNTVKASTNIINTGCFFHGRVMLGGFNPAYYWSNDWMAAIKAYSQAFPFAISDSFAAPGNNFVSWSTIGGGDVFNLFSLDAAVYGQIKEDQQHTLDRPLFMEFFQRNELGLAPMPWHGMVQVLKPLRDKVVAYGTDGICLLVPANIPYPTFGLQPLARFGVAGRGSVAGNDSIHVFVASNGDLWTIDSNGVITKLGYKEYLSAMLNYPITAGYDEFNQEFHFSGSALDGSPLSYCLTKNGLFQSPYHIRSLVAGTDGPIGTFDIDSSPAVVVVTDIEDFQYRDFKTITGFELGLTTAIGATTTVAVDYRNSPGEAFATCPAVPVNPEGFAYIRCTAHEFRFRVCCSDYENFQLTYINVKWQPSGRRIVRGLGANEAQR